MAHFRSRWAKRPGAFVRQEPEPERQEQEPEQELPDYLPEPYRPREPLEPQLEAGYERYTIITTLQNGEITRCVMKLKEQELPTLQETMEKYIRNFAHVRFEKLERRTETLCQKQ